MNTEGFMLFARPSFFEGAARLIDTNGVLNTYNKSKTPDEADFRAIQSDWEAVGMDIKFAIKKFVKKNALDIDHEP